MTCVSKKIFVTGRVQGVFFRDSTRQLANELNLTGGVRNLRDGRVEVRISGEEENIQALIKWLEIGPKLAKVSTIEVISLDELAQRSGYESGHIKPRFEIWSSQ